MKYQIELGRDLLAMPPMDAVFNRHVGNFVTVVCVLSILGLLLSVMRRPRERVIATAMVVGGALTSMIEPFITVATGAFHPLINQDTVFTFMGRGIPVWIVVCYASYYGGLGSLQLRAYTKGIPQYGVWLWSLVPYAVDILIEEIFLQYDLYYYYGNQPLVLIKLPVYQAPGSSTAVLMGVTMLFFMQPYLKEGWRWFAAAAVVMPLGGVIGWVAVALPSFYAVHSTWPNWMVQSCGVATFVLAGLWAYGVGLLVGVDSPLRNKNCKR